MAEAVDDASRQLVRQLVRLQILGSVVLEKEQQLQIQAGRGVLTAYTRSAS